MNITSPIDQSIYKTVQLHSKDQALDAVEKSSLAQKLWKKVPLSERIRIVSSFVSHFVADKEDIATELSWLIGRPRKQNFNEINGVETRAKHMISIAEESLKDTVIEESDQFTRYMSRDPVGVVFIIAAWNYPYLVSVNGVVPAILAGNSVILKQAPQTFPCADRFFTAFKKAGLPDGVFQVLHIDHPTAELVIKNPLVGYIHFTGSVRGGRAVNKLASERFITVGLELGGKDPAYVREDADPKFVAEQLIDGAMYNSGQSCCGIERIYVHEKVYDDFIKYAAETVSLYNLGLPFDEATNLGPVVTIHSANLIREQIADAVSKGATLLVDQKQFPMAKEGTPFVAPQVLVNVNHSMKVMKEETFGPIVGVMKVKSDEEAIQLMNDSDFGLTACVWTKDITKGHEIGKQLETGTFFVNRCDYLDPSLAWIGVKDSGRGCTLGKYGFDQLTRPKSYHLRK
ncbi:aldehyde dehydrogenase domain-containing protein [Globomyces pollinis-pini]|nr:aldehyde dehydrogenase domain-containing protein [Globomyces pollinis-pini]